MMRQYFTKMLFGLFCCLQISYIFCEKVLINIDRIVRGLDDTASIETECDIKNWANQLSNACKCCLFKWVPKIGTGPGQKTVDQIVEECNKKKYCTSELIKSFKESVPSAPDFTTALYQLYNTSIVIKKIDKKGITFDANGNLTEEGVKTFLEKAYKEGKLPYEDFKSVTCIKVQNILAEEAGEQTTQLFLITSNCSKKSSSYILKGMDDEYTKPYDEIKGLARLLELKQLDDLIWPNRIKDYPSLATPFAFFQYNNHHLSLAPKADGRKLSTYVLDLKKQDFEQAYFDVGFTLAKFHQRFMKNQNDIFGLTVVHGDFRDTNIFYDITTRQVIYIDNGTMADSLKNPKSPMVDIERFLRLLTRAPGQWVGTLLPRNKAITPLFLKGYISGYHKKDWPILLEKLNEESKIILPSEAKQEIQQYTQLEIARQSVQQQQPKQEELENSLVELTNSLSALTKFLSIGYK